MVLIPRILFNSQLLLLLTDEHLIVLLAFFKRLVRLARNAHRDVLEVLGAFSDAAEIGGGADQAFPLVVEREPARAIKTPAHDIFGTARGKFDRVTRNGQTLVGLLVLENRPVRPPFSVETKTNPPQH